MKLFYLQRKSNILPPWPIFIGESFANLCVDTIYKGRKLGNVYFIGKKDEWFFCGDEKTNFDKLSKEIQEDLMKDPDYVTKIRKKFDKGAGGIQRLIDLTRKLNISKLSDEDLAELYSNIMVAYASVYPDGEPVAFYTQEFGDKIEPYILKEKKAVKEEFHALITPIEKTFLQKEHEDILKIALEVINQKLNPSQIKQKINQHTKDFTWLPYDYGAVYYNEEYFMHVLNKLLKLDKKELEKDYNRLVNYSGDMKQQHKELINKYSIDDYRWKLFQVVQNSSYLMDYKKEIFTKLHWYSNPMFEEIAKRLNITKLQAHYILPGEMNDLIFKKKKVDTNELDERYNYILYKMSYGKDVEVLSGENAKPIVEGFMKEHTKKQDINEVRGRTAYPGKVIGEVRLIMNAKECRKINHGEILVTTMTSPDYMIAVHKCAAIVTDEGGITTHAAIVSRELKKPCIMATKNATKVFKDGDLVEVDADEGVVRKL